MPVSGQSTFNLERWPARRKFQRVRAVTLYHRHIAIIRSLERVLEKGLTILLIFIAVVIVYTIAKVRVFMKQSDKEWEQVDKSKLKEWEDEDDWGSN